MDSRFKREIAPMLAPRRNVADGIPVRSISEEGIMETREGFFSATYQLVDTGYLMAKISERENMFIQWRNLLNCLDTQQMLQLTIYNHRIEGTSEADSILQPEIDDGLDELRSNYNKIILRSSEAGNNGIVKEKYLTLSEEAADMAAAEKSFISAETGTGIITHISDIPGADAKRLILHDRLELLKTMYNPGSRSNEEYTVVSGKKIRQFNLDNMYSRGVSARDMIKPPNMQIGRYHCKFGKNQYVQALDATGYPNGTLNDDVLSVLTNLSFDVILTVNIERIDSGEALRMIENKLTNNEAAYMDAYSNTGVASHKLNRDQKELEMLNEDVSELDQSLFRVRMHMLVYGDTLQELREHTEAVKKQASGRKIYFTVAEQMQEQYLCSTIPFGLDCTYHSRTLNSNSTAILMPFSSQELRVKRTKDQHPVFFGNNRTTKSLVSYDRFMGDSYGALVFGFVGSGKSFTTKFGFIIGPLLADPDIDILILDSKDGEFAAVTQALGGQVIDMSGSGDTRMSPLEINADYAGNTDPVAAKVSFLQAFCQAAVGMDEPLNASQKNAIVRAGKKTYEKWLEHDMKDEYMPVLEDFYANLEERFELYKMESILNLLQAIDRFTDNGVEKIFSGRSNINIKSRIVDFDISRIGNDVRDVAMLTITDYMKNRMVRNKELRRKTVLILEEIHRFVKSPITGSFIRDFWKTCRSFWGAPVGITQDTEDLLGAEDGHALVNNSPFVVLMKQSELNKSMVAKLFNLSESQLSQITNSKPGEGLLYIQSSQELPGTRIIPFKLEVPEDSLIFKLCNTKMKKEEDGQD